MLTEFNLADWKTEDKEWVKARKLQWKEIEKRWRVADPSFSRRKYMPIFRDFFLTGKLDLDDFYESQGGSFTLMLLHPNQTYEQLRLFMDAIMEPYRYSRLYEQYNYTYNASVEGAQGFHQFEKLGGEGLFYGLDELYARLFFGDHCHDPRVLKFGGYTLGRIQALPEQIFESYLGFAAFFMLGVTKYPYVREQYMAEYWYSAIEYNTKPFAQMAVLPMFLQAIYYFEDYDVQDGVAGRRKLAEELRQILDNRPLPDELAEIWHTIKTPQSGDRTKLETMRNRCLGTSAIPEGFIA
jgi:hypothetical protein